MGLHNIDQLRKVRMEEWLRPVTEEYRVDNALTFGFDQNSIEKFGRENTARTSRFR